ncbi:hypothetical protein AXK11_01220 [Cephaloticoccus primus]|uniref:Uncharacterized protein n=1 Tax=Cephaloticoccus primus TaxID=1548207 RepID=A0A139SU18_9BACT|nr:hypothetical protein [Cephaloticoccus primus]KXU38089.1 hypothetical protein AXK11_01220 [Cephaloticoccus primus]
MNKTLLLIIIDFLFLNLIALTQWEKLEVSRPPVRLGPQIPAEPGDGPDPIESDLVAAMQLSLADEAARRAALAAELDATAQDLAAREAQLARTQESLQQREANLQHLSEAQRAAELARQQREAEAALLAEEIQRALAQAQRDAALSREQMQRLRLELEAKEAEAARQAAEMAKLEEQRLAAETRVAAAQEQIQGLSVAVQVAEQEKQFLQTMAETFRSQADAEREDRVRVQEHSVRLAQGIDELAEEADGLKREIREHRPINANLIYDEFLANRISVRLRATRQGVFGKNTRDKSALTILVNDGQQTFVLLHVEDTPFSVVEQGSDWEQLKLSLTRPQERTRVEPAQLAFLDVDPRLVALPISEEEAASLGVKIYTLATDDPFKFPEAVLISGGGKGYGEVPFKLNPAYARYVKLDNRLIKRLLGNFSPSRGDLVFSKSGQLLGIMVNKDYCALVTQLSTRLRIRAGDDIRAQKTSTILNAAGARYRALPVNLY